MCVVSPLPETYLFGTRPRVQAQKTFFDIRPNSTHVRPQRICLVPLLSSPVPTHAYLSIFHPSLSSVMFQLELKTLGWLVETCGDNKPRNWMIFEWGVAPWFVVRLPSKRVLNATLAMDGVRTPSADVMICIS